MPRVGRKWRGLDPREYIAEAPYYPVRLYSATDVCHMLRIHPATLRTYYVKPGHVKPMRDRKRQMWFSTSDIAKAIDIRLPGITEERKQDYLANFVKGTPRGKSGDTTDG